MTRQVTSGNAYILWCLWLFGIGGAQRLYTGEIVTGLIYLFTWGLFGIGQLIDLALIPGMVDRRNQYLKQLQGNAGPNLSPSVTLNIGDIPQFKGPTALNRGETISSKTPMQKLLEAAQEHGGQLSIAQAALYTELAPEDIKKLLHEAETAGYAQIGNDPNTGAIRYFFDL